MGLTQNKLLLTTHLEAITAYKAAAQERLPPFFFILPPQTGKQKRCLGACTGRAGPLRTSSDQTAAWSAKIQHQVQLEIIKTDGKKNWNWKKTREFGKKGHV